VLPILAEREKENGEEAGLEYTSQKWFKLMQKPIVNYFKVSVSTEPA